MFFQSHCAGQSSFTEVLENTWFQFVLIEKASGRLIGDIGIHFLETDAENKQVEIGYTLDKNYRGKGYASEALE